MKPSFTIFLTTSTFLLTPVLCTSSPSPSPSPSPTPSPSPSSPPPNPLHPLPCHGCPIALPTPNVTITSWINQPSGPSSNSVGISNGNKNTYYAQSQPPPPPTTTLSTVVVVVVDDAGEASIAGDQHATRHWTSKTPGATCAAAATVATTVTTTVTVTATPAF